MIRLTEHIAYLLTCHDCVIVPGWGAFIAQRTSASFDPATGVFTPPCRCLTFNASIADTDGLLARSVSRREQIPYARAVDRVAAEVDALRHQLENDGELVIPRVGTFRRMPDGLSPMFEPAADGVANIPYRSLPLLKPHAVSQPEVEPSVAEVAAVSRRSPRRRMPAFVRIAAAMALLLGAGYAVTAPDSGARRTDYASMTPAAASRPSEIMTDDIQKATELFIAQPADPDASVTITPEDVAGHVAAVPARAARYCLVVASLPSRAMADRFIASTGDGSLRVLENGGRYRVYVAEGDTYGAALARKASVASRYPDAWVCRR